MIDSDALNENTGEKIEPPNPEEATSIELGELRAGIDSLDEEIVRLLDRRARLARRIGEIKQRKGLQAYAPARERAVLNRVTALSAGDFPRGGLEERSEERRGGKECRSRWSPYH